MQRKPPKEATHVFNVPNYIAALIEPGDPVVTDDGHIWIKREDGQFVILFCPTEALLLARQGLLTPVIFIEEPESDGVWFPLAFVYGGEVGHA